MAVDLGDPVVETRIRSDHLRFFRRWAVVWGNVFSRMSGLRAWAWPVAIGAALMYTACFASFISRHTSLPFWDGFVYVQKTRDLAENFRRASLVERLNPALYLKGIQPERPPLLIAAAAILVGPNLGNAAIAYLWLTLRVAVILLALYLLSRHFGTSAFVPAAALVIFGSPLMCNFYRLYFMDEPFGAFGLLAFALILIDDQRQTVWSALGAAASILALFLVKPVAPAFVLPFCVVRGARTYLSFRQQRFDLRSLIRWALPYGVLLVIMLLLLYTSPYGPGIREQYKLGQTGYWHRHVSFAEAVQLIALMVPPWLLVALLIVALLSRGVQHKPAALYVAAGFLWWVLFSFGLTYTVEDRLLGQAMPYLVTGILVCICHRPQTALVATLAAGFFFTYNIASANGRTKPRSKTFQRVRVLSPVPQHQQPVPEVGLLPFASQLQQALQAENRKMVYGLFSDVYVEPNVLNMAQQMTTQPPWVFVASPPGTPQDFNLARSFRTRWFITKTRRPHDGSAGTGLWTTMNCLHWAITDPESPLHTYFQQVIEAPIHQPDLEDTLVLWHLSSPPPEPAIAETLRWLKPRLTNEPPAFSAVIDSQLRALSSNSETP